MKIISIHTRTHNIQLVIRTNATVLDFPYNFSTTNDRFEHALLPKNKVRLKYIFFNGNFFYCNFALFQFIAIFNSKHLKDFLVFFIQANCVHLFVKINHQLI